jgi:hypothetical protein
VAIGLAGINPVRAAAELRGLNRGQWYNGMMPHMIYSSRFPYKLEGLLWHTNKFSPGSIRTSGLTQPPMLAIATERVVHALPPSERTRLLREMLPVLIKFHSWIYRERDPDNTGLAVCLHSWESGLDDTPYWTQTMDNVPPPPLHWRWLREYRRVHADERAAPKDVTHMMSLLYIMKKYHYDSARIMANSPVMVQDLVFNSILAAANESLERLAESAGLSLPPELHRRFAPTRRALESLWDSQSGAYYSRDRRANVLIRAPSVATFMPLFAGTAAPPRAEAIRRLLISEPGFNTAYPVPSVPTTSRVFEAQRYWRGPVWVNMNWFIIAGLQRYGFSEEADWLRTRTLGLVDRSGFREYFNPVTGEGLGASGFSWSAALTLDLLRRPAAEALDHD